MKNAGKYILATLAAVMVLVFVPVILFHFPMGSLAFGWWRFLQRNMSGLSLNGSVLVTGLVCSVAIILLGHWLCSVLFRQIQQSRVQSGTTRAWPLRWTICLYAFFWVLFLVAFGSAGVYRHASWLRSSGEPWYKARRGRYNTYLELKQADLQIRVIMSDYSNINEVKKEYGSTPSQMHQRGLINDWFDVLFYGDASNNVAAYVIIPRIPQKASNEIFAVWDRGSLGSSDTEGDLFHPMSELQQTIDKLDLKYKK